MGPAGLLYLRNLSDKSDKTVPTNAPCLESSPASPWLSKLYLSSCAWPDRGPGEGLRAGLASEVQERPAYTAEVYSLAKRMGQVSAK